MADIVKIPKNEVVKLDDDSRLARVEEKVQAISTKIVEHDNDIERNTADIYNLKESVQKVSSDLEIIRIYSKNTDEVVREIKVDIKENNREVKESIATLRAIRDDDHLIKPLDRVDTRQEKVWWGIVGGAIGVIVPLLVMALVNLLGGK